MPQKRPVRSRKYRTRRQAAQNGMYIQSVTSFGSTVIAETVYRARLRETDYAVARRMPSQEKLAASLRQEARERRIISNVKPFNGTLRVTNPVRQSRASSRKRVWRGGG